MVASIGGQLPTMDGRVGNPAHRFFQDSRLEHIVNREAMIARIREFCGELGSFAKWTDKQVNNLYDTLRVHASMERY